MKKLIILFIAGILSAFSMDAQVIFRLSAGGVPGLMASTSQDFVLDRPFLFVVTNGAGLPLFVGVVNHPAAA